MARPKPDPPMRVNATGRGLPQRIPPLPERHGRRRCLPTKTDKLPSGGDWLHEIKHDGFRIIARKKGSQVRLYSRPGNDLTHRFPLIVETLGRLRSRSCIIDGEAVACDDNGVASFDLIGGDGPTVFAHACKLGLEGIVSKRKDSAYRSGRSPD